MANNRDETIRYQFEGKGGDQIDALKNSIDKLAGAIEHSGEASEKSDSAFKFLKEHLAEIISIAAAVELALKGIEFGKESLKNAEAVEVSLSRVKALAGEAADAFDDMDKAVEEAAIAVNVTTGAAAAALAKLAENGLSSKSAIDALVPTLQLAKIANIDVATAAAEVARELKAFNLPASDAQKVVDELTAASHGAAGGLAAMSSAAAALAPDAKALGLQFDDVVSILGLLNSKGIDTEKSVRGLRTVFQELQNPSSNLRVELLGLGDGTNDFGAAVAALSAKTPRANEALLSLSGPARTLIETLGQAGPGAIAAFNAKLQETQGIAARTAAILDDNLQGAATKFGNAIETIGEKLAKPVLEPLKVELEKLAAELTKFAQSPDFEDLQKEIGEIAKNGARALDEFLHNIDWKTFLQDGKAALSGIKDDMKSLADNASSLAEGINKVFGTVGVAYHGVVGAVDGVAASVAKAADAAVGGLGKMTVALSGSKLNADAAKEAFDKLHLGLDSFAEVALEKVNEHATGVSKNLAYLTGNAEGAAVATEHHGDAADKAAPKVFEHAKATAEASQQTKSLTETLKASSSTQAEIYDAISKSTSALSGFAAQLAATRPAVVLTAEDVKGAFTKLRISSQQELENLALAAKVAFETINATAANTSAGLADRQNGFVVYARAALAASASLDEGTKSAVRAQLEARAAALGITLALKDLEDASAKSSASMISDSARLAAQIEKDAGTIARAESEVQARLESGTITFQRKAAASFNAGVQAEIAGSKTSEAAEKAEKGFTQWGDAADAAALKTQGISIDASHANEALDRLNDTIAATLSRLNSVSTAAGDEFTKLALDIGKNLETPFGPGGMTDGFAAAYDAIAKSAATVDAQIAQQRATIQGEIGDLNALGEAGSKGFGSFGENAADAAKKMGNLADLIQSGNYDAGLLGQQDLQPLLAALDAARQRADALANSEKQASDQLKTVNEQLKDQLDTINGNKIDQENRNYDKQRDNILELEKTADAAGKREAEEALKNLDLVHKANLKAIQDAADAQIAAQNKVNNNTAANSGSSSSGGSSSTTASTGSGSVVTLNHVVNIPPSSQGSLANMSDADIQILAQRVVGGSAQEMTYQVLETLRREKLRSRF